MKIYGSIGLLGGLFHLSTDLLLPNEESLIRSFMGPFIIITLLN